jgi:hypothetical protein
MMIYCRIPIKTRNVSNIFCDIKEKDILYSITSPENGAVLHDKVDKCSTTEIGHK